MKNFTITLVVLLISNVLFAQRVTDSLQVLYTFEEGTGNTINDVSGVGTPLNLNINSPAAISWTNHGLTVLSSASISSSTPGSKIITACQSTNEITIEAWLIPATTVIPNSSRPARIFSLSNGTLLRDFTLGQGKYNLGSNLYDVRLRTTSTGLNGSSPSLESPPGTLTLDTTHVVYTRSVSGNATIYVNGVPVNTANILGNLSNWDTNYLLFLANESTGDRPWTGEFLLAAIYNRALDSAEVQQNFEFGEGGPGSPVITSQPSNQTVFVQQTATFTISATGVGTLTYLWKKDGVDISGANGTSYTTPPVELTDDGAVYTCVVTDDIGSLISDGAVLTVNPSPVITQQPIDQTVLLGQPATFTITATGAVPLTYQWQEDGINIPSANNNTYITDPAVLGDSGNVYSCIVSDFIGNSDTSGTAVLHVNPSTTLIITQQPIAQTKFVGETATFTVEAAGVGTLTYQWKKDNIDISGANSPSYTTPPVELGDNGAVFTCVVTDDIGNVTSDGALLTVNATPVITQQPINQTVFQGQTATFNISATGAVPLSYQWQVNGNNINELTCTSPGTAYIASTAAYGEWEFEIYKPTSNAQDVHFISDENTIANMDGYGFANNSNEMFVVGESVAGGWTRKAWTGNDYISLNTWHTIKILRDGSNQFTLYFDGSLVDVSGGGGTNPFTDATATTSNYIILNFTSVGAKIRNFSVNGIYVNLENFTDGTGTFVVTSENNNSFTTEPTKLSDNGNLYRCIITDLIGNKDTTNAATLNVNPSPVITQQPLDQTVFQGQTATFTITATGLLPLTYQWQENGINIPLATNNSYTTNPAAISDSGNIYRCLVLDAIGNEDTSGAATLNVNPSPVITQQPVDQTVDEGFTATFTVAATGALPLTYQWQENGVDIPLANSSTYITDPTAFSDSGNVYRCIITDALVNSDTSNDAVLHVIPSTGGPLIDIWNGNVQYFGAFGNPQRWINITGNVFDADGVDSLYYKLNGGTPGILNIGPDTRRLAEAGDFNIEIDTADLLVGINSVLITAKDSLSNISEKTVTVNYSVGNSISTNYTIDWDTVSNIQNVIQIVDGNWDIQDGMLRTTQIGYDRVAALGNTNWTNYEITVPVIIHEILPVWAAPSYGAGLGILTGWTGHTDNIPGFQPRAGFTPLGCYGLLQWINQFGNIRYMLYGNDFLLLNSGASVVPMLDTLYYYKLRVEATPTGPFYSFKAWLSDEVEPDWLLTGASPNGLLDPQTGSILLNAHHVDASFGDIGVESIFATLEITQQPLDQYALVGQTATFTIDAIGAGNLSYQWKKNGVDIPSTDSTSYTTPATTLPDSGSVYTCVVSDSLGSITSNGAILHVLQTSPIITQNPTDKTILLNQTATFTVTATGVGTINYQWQKNGSDIVSANSSSYTTPAASLVDSGSVFRCIVSDSVGIDTSGTAVLHVLAASPVITQQPVDQTVLVGQTATFSITASGVGLLTYQWRKNFGDIAGATGSSYTTPAATLADSGSIFTCFVSDDLGSVSSDGAIMHVSESTILITEQPSDTTVIEGNTATFSISVTGSGSLSYQWKKNGSDIIGATTSSYTTPATSSADSGSVFSCFIADDLDSIESNGAILHVIDITWSASISISDNGGVSTGEVIIGQSNIATNGIDPLLEEGDLPPPPPPGTFDARLIVPEELISTLKDFRNSGLESVIWKLTLQPGLGGYPVLISWDPLDLPPGIFILKDPVNGSIINIDMQSANSYSLADGSFPYLVIEYGVEVCVDVPVQANWNLISVPVGALDMDKGTLFPTFTAGAYSYENGYVLKDILENGKGYWLKFDSTETFNICGLGLSGSVGVIPFWNLVGVYDDTVSVSSITTTPGGLLETSFFGFNGGYTVAENLVPGKGYWVKSSGTGEINLNDVLPKGAVPYTIVLPNIKQEWGRLIIEDSRNQTATVYVSQEEKEFNEFELPPVPPEGIFDVRYSNDKTIISYSEVEDLLIGGIEYPVKIRVENVDVRIRDKVDGSIVNKVLRNGTELTILNSLLKQFEVTRIEVPVNYELMQNYPNPFNPTTTIKFGIPEAGRVLINIYNLLGEKVELVLNQDMDVGFHEVEFNAAKFASGVYFYQIQSGNFANVKKMMLLK